MAIVCAAGPSSLFITSTCNPNWPEIQGSLQHGKLASDRPDTVLGSVKGWVYAIEFQKRGLLHAHILLIMSEGSRFNSAEAVDAAVSAEMLPLPADDDNTPTSNRLRCEDCMNWC
eukprot:6177927-Pleurochrysis_carterae.AAC.2